MDNSSVKENIIRLRKSLNLSQTEMAERMGISRTAYRNIENGSTKLLSDNLMKIAEICNTTVENVISDRCGDGISGTGLLTDDRDEVYSSAIRKMKESYTGEIDRLTTEINRLNDEIVSLKNHVRTQDALIETKNELIAMLKKVGSEAGND